MKWVAFGVLAISIGSAQLLGVRVECAAILPLSGPTSHEETSHDTETRPKGQSKEVL